MSVATRPSALRRAVAMCLIVAAVAVASPVVAVPAPAAAAPAPGLVPGRYIVTLQARASVAEVAAAHAAAPDVRISRRFSRSLRGFVVDASPTAVKRLARDRRVLRVEPDRVVRAMTTQSSAPWGLDRSDQRALPLDGTYRHDADTRGVSVYVVDSGIRRHDEFAGRLAAGFTAIADGAGTDDCNGHGTHVAGTAGGTVHGVAKHVRLVPVRVLGCDGSGTASGVIAGLDWVARNRTGPSVVTLSLGGTPSASLDDAVRRAVASGVTVVAAAGNEGTDACNRSPARVAEAITVAATDRYDAKPTWSNFGSCVDLFAPGASITSAGTSSTNATATKSGTSMATPHVAGAVALLQARQPGVSPAQVASSLLEVATTGTIRGPGQGSPDRLLFTGAAVTDAPTGGGEPVNQAPVAAAAASCSGGTCTFDASASNDGDGRVVGHRWVFSDGASATTAVSERTFTAAGAYTGTVTVTDDRGATASATATVSCTRSGKGRHKKLTCSDSTTTASSPSEDGSRGPRKTPRGRR